MIDIELKKFYAIYKQSGLIPSEFFEKKIQNSICKDLKIFEILWDKEELKKE